MNTPIRLLALILVCQAVAVAQEKPEPSPELQKFAPLIGSWHGTGTAQMGPGEPSTWESQSTYAWALGNFFVQEDTVVRFSGMSKSLVMRSYLGWDPENRRHVRVGIDNDGTVSVHRLEFAGDGSMVEMFEAFGEGQTVMQRHTTTVKDDVVSFAIDMMATAGAAARAVQGSMKRTDTTAPMAMDQSAFSATPAAALVQLGKTAGTFALEAKMIMMPGMPQMSITGQDVVTPRFDGAIVHVHTTGTAEGMPEQYVGEVFYGYDWRQGCIRAVYISNMGEVGEMTGSFTEDNKNFILTSALRYQGQPCVQRMVMELGADGAPTKAIGHTIVGTAEPYESWNATYTRK